MPVFLDNRYLIAVKKQFSRDKKLPVLDTIDPFSPTLAKQGQEKSALKIYEQMGASSYNNQVRLIISYLNNNQPEQAIQILSKLETGHGPKAVLSEIDKDTLFIRAYLAKNDCSNARFYLGKIKKALFHKFIFDPKRVLSYSADLDSLMTSCQNENTI